MQTLQLQLDESQAAFRAQMPAASLAVVDQSTRDLAGSGVVDTALQVGDHIANFSLTNQNGKSKNLSDFLNAGPLVISFYRGGWCPYCNIELAALQKVLPEIEAAGARLFIRRKRLSGPRGSSPSSADGTAIQNPNRPAR
jgi:thiol-disulfide isomerase/thioredoxin